MKKLLVLVFIFVFCLQYSQGYEVVCPVNPDSNIQNEKLLNKITGTNWVSKKTAEMIIQSELNNSINSGFDADLDIYSIKTLKNGEFKSLKIKNKNLKYKSYGIENFVAITSCEYNKFVYQNKRIYFPENLNFNFSGEITNDSITEAISSNEFKNLLKKIYDKYGVEIQEPIIEISDNKIYFDIPIKLFLSDKPIHVKFNCVPELQEGEIVLKDIDFEYKNVIIPKSLISHLINEINPLSSKYSEIKNKAFNLYITTAKIDSDKIKLSGIFELKRNYRQ